MHDSSQWTMAAWAMKEETGMVMKVMMLRYNDGIRVKLRRQ